MPSFLLDTHILLWWTSQRRRLTKVQQNTLAAVQERGESVAISAISLWELAMMAERGRVTPPMPLDLWLAEIEHDPAIAVFPLSGRIAYESVRLGEGFPSDPAGRLIVATARCHALQLVTSDKRIRRWGGVAVL